MRQKLRRFLRIDYPALSAVLRKRCKQVVKRVHRIPYSLGRLKLHDKQSARQLRSEIECNGYKPLKQLPYAFEIVLGISKAPKALIIILLRRRGRQGCNDPAAARRRLQGVLCCSRSAEGSKAEHPR